VIESVTFDEEVLETLEEVAEERKSQLAYDENYIIALGAHNHDEFYDMVKSKGNATAVVLIYARKLNPFDYQ
jgi:hypothetical protein